MKKQILTLSMCLALTSTVSLAAAATATIQTKVAPIVVAPVKPQVAPVKTDMATCPKLPSQDEIRKKMDERIAKDREIM